ncbi:hypothetical protein [Maribacter hydrothermalis]|uniref:Uncharacterized protein n=1 Tax=Maribacter hydrothermalis TaxID=1836467 RepID=A0A1B7ZD44_9FLAO|nr:hypothetical protein [Maribacter hydrothermalis]APQ18794.1 hypothetical protein BTR34_16375 [Maribacter hydrothermalis]OBR41038.1 hypothetical protein A9200_14550 [Maribacter hydrothermalis]
MTKKNKNYFGMLKSEKLNELSNEQRLKLFKTKKLFVTTKVLKLPSNAPINLLDTTNFKSRIEPKSELVDAYYTFVLHTYQEYINNVFINFFHQFNNHIIGLKKKEAKTVGRLLYINIINNKHSPSFDIVHLLENTHGIPKLENTPKIELYTIKRDTMKLRTIQKYPKGLNEFLMGNSSHFEESLKENLSIIKEIIQFEGELKIILALNDEYKFEENKTIPSIPQNNVRAKSQQTTSNKMGITATMPTDEEMEAYLMEHVFSKKK